MSDLREAIRDVYRREYINATHRGHRSESAVDMAWAGVEAYLRERIEAQITGSTVVAWAVDKGAKAERDRIEQSIEALPELRKTGMIDREVVRAMVLEALGGSDE